MKVSLSASPAQSRQLKQQLANPEERLSYELGKAVQELPPLYTRLVAGGISLMTVGAVAWAHFSMIDEVATAEGKLVPSTEVRPVRASSIGSVSQIKVEAGQVVKKGDVLLEIDPGVAETNVDSLEQEAVKIRENIARLDAESKGQTSGASAEQSALLAVRQQELQNRQAAAAAEANKQVAAIGEADARKTRFEENITSAKTSLKNAQLSRDSALRGREIAQQSLETAQIKESKLRPLSEVGAFSNIEYLTVKDQVNMAKGQLNNASNQITAADNQINEAQNQISTLERELQAQVERIRQAQQAYQGAVSSARVIEPQRMGEVLGQMNQRREELSKKLGEIEIAKKQRQEKTRVTAPFNGTIYNVKVTQGPIQQGEELLSLLPMEQNLVLEAKVLNRDIGFIRKGQEAKIKMATFPYQEFGTIAGTVEQLSPDAIVEKDSQGRDMGPVFPAKIKLSKNTATVRGSEVPFTPGMAASVEIVTRKKSVLSFLIEPIAKRVQDAFSVR